MKKKSLFRQFSAERSNNKHLTLLPILLLKTAPCTLVVPQFTQIVTYYRRAGFVSLNAHVLSNHLCLNI